jgi:hypothetical protein
MEATLNQSEAYLSSDVEESTDVIHQRKVLTLLEPVSVSSASWDSHEVWRRMIKEPRDRQLVKRKD